MNWLKTLFGIPDENRTARLLLGNHDVEVWLSVNLTGERIADLKAIRKAFGLSLTQAVALLEEYGKLKRDR